MARAARIISSRAEKALRRVNPALGIMCARAVSTAAYNFDVRTPVFEEVKILEKKEDEASNIIDLLRTLEGKEGSILDLKDPEPLKVAIQDIDENRFGEIVVISEEDGLELSYGKKGIAPSAIVTPEDLLENKMLLPSKSMGTLIMPEHVPFVINGKGFAFAACNLERVLRHEENISQFSVDKLITMNTNTAKILSIELQSAIFNDRKNEKFFKETTSRIFPPKQHMRSSATFMNFEEFVYGIDNSTDMHFESGDRLLFIFTVERKAGVTLNFCGVLENPDERKDSEVKISFEPNSIYALRLPPFCHHRFHGAFDCINVHPRDGINMIKALESGSLPGGFLESATTFSINGEEKDWSLAVEIPKSKTESTFRSNDTKGGRE